MASFFDRVLLQGGYETDGGDVDLSSLQRDLVLFEAGLKTDTEIASFHANSSAQEEDVMLILNTMPNVSVLANLLSLLAVNGAISSAAVRARWPHMVQAVLTAANEGQAAFNTQTKIMNAIAAAS